MPRTSKPRAAEPIRLIQTQRGARYRVVIDVSKHPRKQITKTLDNLSEARSFVDQTRSSVRDGSFTKRSDDTVSDLAERWLQSRHDVREVTRVGHRSALRPVLARIGNQRVQHITPEQIAELVVSLSTNGSSRTGGPLSHRSIVYALGSLKLVLGYGVRVGLLRSNPAAEVRPPRKRKGNTKEVTIWTAAQLSAFIAAGDCDEQWSHVWRLLACGLRRSELLGLRWTDVDRDTGSVSITQGRVRVGRRTVVDDPKSDASWRVVHVEDALLGSKAILAAAFLRAEDKQGLIVTDVYGRPCSVDTFRAAFFRVCRAAAVPVIRVHAVRHTLAKVLHWQGLPPRDAAQLLGHTYQTHVQFYLPGDEQGTRSASAAVRAALAAAAEG
jgi:integrase